MSAMVRLAAKLPGNDEINGLDHIAYDLCDNPGTPVFALVWFDVAKVTTDVDAGTRVPTVRVRRVEPVGPLSEVPAAVAKLVTALGEKRLGRVPLPLEEFDPGDDEL